MRLEDKYLNTVCEPVQPAEHVIALSLINRMRAACWEGEKHIAVGYAANQFGYNKRIVVIDYAGFHGPMINPVITKYRGGTATAKEGCMSFKKAAAWPVRHKIVQVEYLDEDLKPQRGKYRGLLARIIQHEVDHLNGITMLDRERLGAA